VRLDFSLAQVGGTLESEMRPDGSLPERTSRGVSRCTNPDRVDGLEGEGLACTKMRRAEEVQLGQGLFTCSCWPRRLLPVLDEPASFWTPETL
jgi:hypothetical protein